MMILTQVSILGSVGEVICGSVRVCHLRWIVSLTIIDMLAFYIKTFINPAIACVLLR